MIFEHEVDQEDNALEDSGNEYGINKNYFETEEQKANYVKENLREWATYDGIISKKKLNNLLLRLNPVFPTLPKNYKTLLHTPKHLEILQFPDGTTFWYYLDDRITFLDLNAALRTDESFKNQDDQLHHTGVTILLRIANMVSQFRLDSFHLIWHGAFRRLLSAWMDWNGPWKLSRSDKATASKGIGG
ncbi:hypothetical protein ALC62_00767 [Cyphomyrmex costatus]|uniref:Uncharacterized protein n=1 Tax=Cyphomyrmex costatus TaxID=456900 RepID=A0A151IQ46_9HYME|nr:hypothetical protein ALC62_00767 [Cyphomyrmex costatus]